MLFKLFFQKLFSQLVVFLYLFVDLVPVAIVEYGQHEVKKQIQPEKEVADEEQDGPIILPVEWEDNIWKIWRREKHIHVEHRQADVWKVFRALRSISPLGLKERETEKGKVNDVGTDDHQDSCRVVNDQDDPLPGLSEAPNEKHEHQERDHLVPESQLVIDDNDQEARNE